MLWFKLVLLVIDKASVLYVSRHLKTKRFPYAKRVDTDQALRFMALFAYAHY